MNREDVAGLSVQAGLHIYESPEDFVAKLEHFAALVAAAEREECIEVLLGNFDIRDEDVYKVAADIRERPNDELSRQLQPNTEATEELSDVRGGEVPGQA